MEETLNIGDEDDNKYYGNYKRATLGNSFFMTSKDYINYLERKIADNQDKILEINTENQRLQNVIESMQIEKTKQKVKQIERWGLFV